MLETQEHFFLGEGGKTDIDALLMAHDSGGVAVECHL